MSPADLLRQQLAAAQARCERFTEVLRNLPAPLTRYSSTARTVTANSRWARAREEREDILEQLELEIGRDAHDRTGPCPPAIEVSRAQFDELLAIAEVADGR